MPRLTLSLLGPPRLERDGEPLDFDTRKALALLALLSLSERPMERDGLITLLWPELDRRRGRAALRRTLSVLRKGVGDGVLEIGRDTLALANDAPFTCDVAEFRAALDAADGRGQDDDEILAALERAAALYRGELLDGFGLRDAVGFDDWQLEQSGALRRELTGALERLVDGLEKRGDLEGALRHARRWLDLDPLHEGVHRKLMLLLARAGRRSEALLQYRACVRVLDQELGVPPLGPTEALYRAIQRGEYAAASTASSTDAHDEDHDAPRPGALPTPWSRVRPLVGRTAAWRVLEAARTEASNRRFVVALEGEAGIGKTYLTESFVQSVAADGGAVLRTRCYPDEHHLPYGPFLELLRTGFERPDATERLAHVEPRWLSEVARLTPDLAALVPDLPPPPPLDGPAGRRHLMEGVDRVLAALTTGSGPGVILLDDVHWADPASLDLLVYLARPERAPGMLVLVTLRPAHDDANGRLLHQLATGEREGWAERRTLKRWSRDEVAELLALAGVDLAADDVGRLFTESEGLPFFVNEYLTARLRLGTWGALPQGVRDLLHSRLGAVGAVERQLLQTAAVIGRSFDFDLLRRASGRSDDEVVGGLERLVALGLVREQGGDAGTVRFDFGHEKLRVLVHEETSLARRRLLHGRIADALVGDGVAAAARPSSAGTIAAHLRLAGRDAEAALQYAAAGRHARALFANEEALHHFGTALALGHPDPAGLHTETGDLHTLAGAYERAIADYETAAAMAAPAAVGLLEHKLGGVHQRRGAWETAESHFVAAERLLDPTDARAWAQLLADRSLNAHRRGAAAEALELAQRALTWAGRSEDATALARVHNLLGLLAHERSDVAASVRELEKSLALTVDTVDPSARIAALNNLALVRAETGDRETALGLLANALDLCRRQGDRHREAALLSNRADLLHAAGRDDEAMGLLKQAAALYAAIDQHPLARRPEIWKLVAW